MSAGETHFTGMGIRTSFGPCEQAASRSSAGRTRNLLRQSIRSSGLRSAPAQSASLAHVPGRGAAGVGPCVLPHRRA